MDLASPDGSESKLVMVQADFEKQFLKALYKKGGESHTAVMSVSSI